MKLKKQQILDESIKNALRDVLNEMEYDNSIEFTGDYTDEEKRLMKIKQNRSNAAKKGAKTRAYNRQSKADKEFMDKQYSLGYKDLFGNGKLDESISKALNESIIKLTEDKDNSDKKKKKANKRHLVLQWLQQDEVNDAAIRRQVEGEPETQEEEDAKRSYFMKKVNQTDGKSFSDEEINDLYALKSSLGQ